MRNVRSALLVAAVALMGLTACSFSSSRSWGSGNGSTANPNAGYGSTGKPARHSSGKPAKQVSNDSKPAPKAPTPAPDPVAKPTPPAPTPAPDPVVTKPPREGREDPPSSTPSTGKLNVTPPTPQPRPQGQIGVTEPPKPTKPGSIGVSEPPTPSKPGTIGVTESPTPSKPGTIGISESPKPGTPNKLKLAPNKPKTDKAAPN